MRKYKPVRLPIEAYEGFKMKKDIMENMLRAELKKPKIKLSLADTMRFVANKKVYFNIDELVNIKKNKRRINDRSRLI
jgi:hypothetical protein